MRPGVVGIAGLQKRAKGRTLRMYSDHKHHILFIFYNHRNISQCLCGCSVSSVSKLSVNLDAANLLGKNGLSAITQDEGLLDHVPFGLDSSLVS